MLEPFETLPEPVLAVGDGRITYANLAARRLLVEEAVGRRAEDLFDPNLLPPAAAPVSGVFRSRRGQFTVSAADFGGERVLTLTPLPPEDENSARILRMFTGNVRSGLGSLFASLSLMGERIPESERERFAPTLAKSDKSACILARMADNYARVFCALDSAAVASPLDLRKLVEDVAVTVSALETKEQPEICFEGGGEPLPFMGDGRLLEIMLMQLFSNAIKYAGSGARIAVSVKEGRRNHTITVSDNGPGVRPELLGDVFAAYASPAQSAEPRAGSGRGPGRQQRIPPLHRRPPRQRIAALHGGSAVMESAYGHGAAVTVRLPRRDPETARELHSGYRNDISAFLIQLSDVLDSSVYEKRGDM